MSRHLRRKEFKGFQKMAAVGSYADLEAGFMRDMMVAVCKAATPGRGPRIMSEEDIVDTVFDAIRKEALDVYLKWTDDGAEVKTELRVAGSLPGYQTFYSPSTFIFFEQAATH